MSERVIPADVDFYLSFAAGRRGAGSSDCIVCGTPIHQRPQPGQPSPDHPWFDGHGSPSGLARTSPRMMETHQHAPAPEMGPILGPYRGYVDITYASVRHEGEILAVWDAERGDWIIEVGDHRGEAYSDITIFSKEA